MLIPKKLIINKYNFLCVTRGLLLRPLALWDQFHFNCISFFQSIPTSQSCGGKKSSRITKNGGEKIWCVYTIHGEERKKLHENSADGEIHIFYNIKIHISFVYDVLYIYIVNWNVKLQVHEKWRIRNWVSGAGFNENGTDIPSNEKVHLSSHVCVQTLEASDDNFSWIKSLSGARGASKRGPLNY